MSMHYVTPSEINEISDLGFVIEINGGKSADEFVNRDFKGFDLREFVQQIESKLQPVAEDVIRRKIILNEEVPPKLVISYMTSNILDADHRLLFKRTFTKEVDAVHVKHDFLALPEAARGKRLGRKILQICLQHYLEMGVSKINVHAALETGGYEWTKAGFRATEPSEMAKILNDARSALTAAQFTLVEKLYDNYYGKEPTGNAFPIIEWSGLPFMKSILKNNDWHGELDLTNSEDLFNFKEYANG
jgi:GNAT superfamily N-acetyltransferase